jgi:hypothetical protein
MNEQIENELLSILAECSGVLSERDIDNVRVLLSVGEYGVSFETLCTQLYEYEVRINPSLYERLASVGALLRLNSNTWEILKELILK